MAEGYVSASYNWPTMNWAATDLSKEWERFYQHCEFAFGGPLSKCTEKEKICNLMSFVGDKGQEIYLTFQWDTVQVGSGENRHDISEKGHTRTSRRKIQGTPRSQKEPNNGGSQIRSKTPTARGNVWFLRHWPQTPNSRARHDRDK